MSVAGLNTAYITKSNWITRLFSGKGDRQVKAVNDVSFQIKPGSILGVVGESGCGKTSLAKTVAGLVSPSGGKMEFLGVDVTRSLRSATGTCCAEIQMVFQNPDSTLNPTQTVREIVARPLEDLKSGTAPGD